MRLSNHCILLSLILLFTVTTGCRSGNGGDGSGGGTTACSQPSGLVKGHALSPFGFPLTYDNLPSFYSEIGSLSNAAVMWNGLWRNNLAASGTIPNAARNVMDNSTIYCYAPVAVFGWRSGTTLYLEHPSDPTNNWSNTFTRAAFRDMLVNFAATYRPKYLFIGNENDFFYESFLSDYPDWLSFYNSAYDAIKVVSPETSVGPVFNFEHLSGSGSLNGWNTAYWNAVTDHNMGKVDIVGITIYPFFSVANANSVTANYLQPLFDRIGSKPVAITETGWPGERLGGYSPAWNISEQEQIDYVPKIFTIISGRDVRLVNWLFLHQVVDYCSSCMEWKQFGSISLYNSSGNTRPALSLWRSY